MIPAAPSRLALAAAYLALYVVWGSTYLAIRIAIESLPPFAMASVRFLIAGGVLYAWARLRGAAAPTRAQWKGAAVVGGLLLLGGNGAVVWAEQTVPSGVAALLVATLPFWMVLLQWLRGEQRPSGLTMAGIWLGLVGIVVLIGPDAIVGAGNVPVLGAAVLVLGSLSWALGSLHSRTADKPASPALGSALQMLAGGALLAGAALLHGELFRFDASLATAASLGAVAYLIVFGSLVGFSAYIWLLRVEPPARVATYAFVNPVVAVLLGWLVLGEPLTTSTLVAAAIIVAAVALVVRGQAPRPTTPAAAPVELKRAA